MRTFFHIISLFALLAFGTQPSVADAPVPICKSEAQTCTDPHYQLVYTCVEKGSQACDKKSQFYKECCEGVFVQSQYEYPINFSVQQPYVPGDSACCDGKPFSKSWEGCCDGRTFLLAYDTCCEGRIVPIEACCCNKIIDPRTTGCCNGKPYNYRTQACCGGEILCGSSEIRLTPKECENCMKRNPSCFYATVNGSDAHFFAQPCGDQAVIYFPEALCPDDTVQVCMHPQCGTSPVITGNPKDGYILEGVCRW